jgi:hypothetical protein
MSIDEVVRRWKECEDGDNPAGCMEITDEELQEVGGYGRPTNWPTCTFHATCAANGTIGPCCRTFWYKRC